MRLSKKILCTILSAIILCAGFSPFIPMAAAAEYEDGVYSAGVSMVGEGWHNSVVSPTTVYIEDGAVYVDIVFVRTSSPWHAPAYVSLTTAYGTYTDPVIDESNYTCAFYHVRIDALGEIPFSAVTEAMSVPHSVDYSVYIDPDAVPVKAADPEPVPAADPEPSDEPAPGEDPEQTDDPDSGEDPQPAPGPEPAEQQEPEKEADAKPDGPDAAPDKEEPAGDKADTPPAEEQDAVPTTGGDGSEDAGGAGKSQSKLSAGAVTGIAAAAVVIIAAAVVLAKKKK